MMVMLLGIQFVFFVLYMTDTINWAWYWVLSPVLFIILLNVLFLLALKCIKMYYDLSFWWENR